MADIGEARIQRINTLYRELSTLFVNSIEKTVELGEELLEVKKTLDHGQFRPWIEEHFPFSHRTANKWMNVALNKKEIRKLIKGNRALSLTDAYSAGVVKAVTPKSLPLPAAKRGIPREASEAVSALWDRVPSVPLERHKVHAKGGNVLMLADGMREPVLICTVTLDPVAGCERAFDELDANLQALFEQYLYVIEQHENGSSGDEPECHPLRNVTEGEAV